MMNKVPFLAIILGVVLVVIAVVLPSGSGDAKFVRLMKMLPEDIGEFTYFDVGVLQSDEDLQSQWTSIKEYFLGDEIFGQNVSSITGFGVAGSEYSLILLSGDFDLEEMKQEIEQSSLESFEYEGATIWKDQYSFSTVVIDDVVLMGEGEDVKMCVNVSNGNSASLYDDKYAKDIIGRLPGGYMSGLTILGEENSSGTYGILAVGLAAYKQGGNVSQTTIMRFEDSEAALEYIELIEEEGSVEDYDITQDDQYLTVLSTLELPSPEEEAYNSVYDDLDYAIYAYYYLNAGALPTLNGTINIDGYDCRIIDICALLESAGGILGGVPEGLAGIDGPDNDNCDSGCAGCSAEGHYIWAVDDYGIYSTCVGEDCEANGADGFQGVWP